MIATAEERAILKAICEICSIEQIHAITELVLAERTPAPEAASAPKLCGCGFPPHVGRCQPAATPSDAVTHQPGSMQPYLDTFYGHSSPWSEACHEGMARTLNKFAEALRDEMGSGYTIKQAISNLLPEVPRV